MRIRQIAKEVERASIRDDIISKPLSHTGFTYFCNTLKEYEEGNGHELTMDDVEFLKDYYDLSKFY